MRVEVDADEYSGDIGITFEDESAFLREYCTIEVPDDVAAQWKDARDKYRVMLRQVNEYAGRTLI
jgi:hypothetical protein